VPTGFAADCGADFDSDDDIEHLVDSGATVTPALTPPKRAMTPEKTGNHAPRLVPL
jgi:hypothetical protein